MDGKWFGEFSRQVEMCRVVSISAEASSTCFVHGKFHRPGFLPVGFQILVRVFSCPVAVFLATEIFNDFNCTFSRPLCSKKNPRRNICISARCSHRRIRLDSTENFLTLHPFIHPSKVSDTKRKQDTYVALVETNRDTGTFLSHRDEIIGDDWLATGRLLAEVVEVGADSKFLQCFWVRRWVHRLGA